MLDIENIKIMPKQTNSKFSTVSQTPAWETKKIKLNKIVSVEVAQTKKTKQYRGGASNHI
ncbi:MAG: hypothetical protein K1X86_04960 [Ignavibacteria bacterium]|nr:hypothetical protein [Ignavibacteria bacterium]